MEAYPATVRAFDDRLAVPGLAGWVMGFLTDGAEPIDDGVSEAVRGSDKDLYGACKGGWERLIRLAVDLGATDLDWGLRYACSNGHTDCARAMVDLGSTDLNEGLWNACEWGQLDCARLMVELGAKELNRGLRWACGWGHADCARLMVSLGATSCEACGGAKHDFAP
jgi:hypothetical protein